MKKLDLKRIIIVSLIPMAWQFIWMLYNTYVPVFLQSGNPGFVTAKVITLGFGLAPALVGVIMSMDNVASFFLIPIVGILSDRTWTRFGRRTPFIMASAPIAIISFSILPLIILAIPPELNGQTGQLTYLLIPFIAVLVLTLLPYATMDLPSNILLYDITPVAKRATANGIRGVFSAMGVLSASLGGAALFKIYIPLPFWVGAFLLLAVILAVVFFVKEQRELQTEEIDEKEKVKSIREIFRLLKNLPTAEAQNVIKLALCITISYVGIAVYQAFFSSYAVTVLGLSVERAGVLMSMGAIAYIVTAIPSGIIADKIGRKNNLCLGIGLLAVVCLAIFFVRDITAVTILLCCFGIAYALMDVNTGPYMLDHAPSQAVSGTYLAFRQVSNSFGFILGPILGGFLVSLLGSNYNTIWIIIAVISMVAFVFLFSIDGRKRSKDIVS